MIHAPERDDTVDGITGLNASQRRNRRRRLTQAARRADRDRHEATQRDYVTENNSRRRRGLQPVTTPSDTSAPDITMSDSTSPGPVPRPELPLYMPHMPCETYPQYFEPEMDCPEVRIEIFPSEARRPTTVTFFTEPWAADEMYTNYVPLDSEEWIPCFFSRSRDPLTLEYPFELHFRGRKFPSAAVAYQCTKASAWKMYSEAQYIDTMARDGDDAMLMGRALRATTLQRRQWAHHKVSIMKDILAHKFQQCSRFRQALKTAFRYINVSECLMWGTGCDAAHIEFRHNHSNQPRFPGTNALGRLLTLLSQTQDLTGDSLDPLIDTTCTDFSALSLPPSSAPTWRDTFKPDEDYTGAVPVPKAYNRLAPFSGHTDPRSNFFPCTLHYKGIEFASAEHAYQFAKALCFEDTIVSYLILHQCTTALDAKKAARKLHPNPKQNLEWTCHRIAVMKEILEEKRLQCAAFRNKLHHDALYVETTRDRSWGSGLTALEMLHATQAALPQFPTFPGDNMLGLLITRLAQTGTLRGAMYLTNTSTYSQQRWRYGPVHLAACLVPVGPPPPQRRTPRCTPGAGSPGPASAPPTGAQQGE